MSGDKLFSTVNMPNECVLLIGTPLNLNAFKQDVAMANASVSAQIARGDYAFQMLNALATPDIKTAWQQDGSVIAGLCDELIADANSVGVKIYTEATSESLAQAINEGAKVIIVVAHWKSARVSVYDIRLEALPDTLATLQASSDIFACKLFKILSTTINNARLPMRASVLADAISSAICAEAGFPNARPDDAFMNAAHHAHAIGTVRDQVDKLLPDFIVSGNCLELRDGYHKAADIAAIFSEQWSGVVELAVCHSLYLAQAIKAGRHDRRIITNELAKYPERCIPELRETFLRLSLGGQNYIKLRLDVFATYSQMLLS